jgi:hypothetical protein
LAILEPIILPTAISEGRSFNFAVIDEIRDTDSSGKEVPNAITVNPMIKGEIPNFLAKYLAESIVKSAPFIRM